MLEELRSLDTSPKSLRSFGLLIGGITCLLAGLLLWRSGSPKLLMTGPAILALIGLVVLASGLFLPSILRPVYLVWMALAFLLGAVMTRVVLSIAFALLIVPVGLVMKALGRDPLGRRRGISRKSYWISRADMDRSAERLEKYY